MDEDEVFAGVEMPHAEGVADGGADLHACQVEAGGADVGQFEKLKVVASFGVVLDFGDDQIGEIGRWAGLIIRFANRAPAALGELGGVVGAGVDPCGLGEGGGATVGDGVEGECAAGQAGVGAIEGVVEGGATGGGGGGGDNGRGSRNVDRWRVQIQVGVVHPHHAPIEPPLEKVYLALVGVDGEAIGGTANCGITVAGAVIVAGGCIPAGNFAGIGFGRDLGGQAIYQRVHVGGVEGAVEP